MIIDIVKLYLQSGKGGKGHFSMINLSAMKSVDSGGNGGKGGDVILKISPHIYDLSKFRGNKQIIAKDGETGAKFNKQGKDAEPSIVFVPLGTRVIEKEKIICDLTEKNDEFLICKGGFGGKGNYRRGYSLPAGEGVGREVNFDYRIPADVAFLGFANSGKTSLFNSLTNKTYKVAEYPFTTSSCIWADSEYEFKIITVLDTPAFKRRKTSEQFIDNKFLKHIFRCKIIVLLSDDCSNCEQDFEDLIKEIKIYDESLLKGKIILKLLTKVDKIGGKINNKDILTISVNESQTIEGLQKKLLELLELNKNE
ncbi:MAG: 50S ribosome-binding GTPase [Candidatus Omnitrophica bacterium]|nr:50S ribosome-binding GTPase [Candidatus Omnitrophota bacterium]